VIPDPRRTGEGSNRLAGHRVNFDQPDMFVDLMVRVLDETAGAIQQLVVAGTGHE
jgi:hypothetical protein